MQAHIARVTALEGLLLGGVTVHESSPMATRQMAEQWAAIVLDTNTRSGRKCAVRYLKVMRAKRVVIGA
jgi:hypothetical protein